MSVHRRIADAMQRGAEGRHMTLSGSPGSGEFTAPEDCDHRVSIRHRRYQGQLRILRGWANRPLLALEVAPGLNESAHR